MNDKMAVSTYLSTIKSEKINKGTNRNRDNKRTFLTVAIWEGGFGGWKR